MLTESWPPFLDSISSVVLAEFDRAGGLRHSNAGMRRLCADSDEAPWYLFTQPRLSDLVQARPDALGRVHAGLLTASTRSHPMLTLTGEVSVDADRVRLVAGYDMDEFEALSSSLLELNNELAVAYRDLTRTARELEIREQTISQLARTDVLTGVGNRRKLDETMACETQRALRYGSALSLFILDIDHFKRVNDSWGHETGDLVLKDVGALLLQGLRENDIATRMGGEEFVVFMPSTGIIDAVAAATRFRLAIAAHTFGSSLHVTASFGVAHFEPKESGSQFLGRADKALYAAKEQGRNRVIAA